jgi:hypothetical protein
MMDVIWMAVAAVAAGSGGLVGASIGAKRGQARAEEDARPRLDAMSRELRRAAAGAQEAEQRGRGASERFRTAALAPLLADAAAPHYADRPAPRELDAIAARLRGFAFLDGAVVADARGLPLSRDDTPAARALSALIAHAESLEKRAEGALEGVVEISVTTQDARHAALRRLPEWTRGAWLGALAQSQPPAPLALDAAVAGALLARPEAPNARSGRPALAVASALAGHHAIAGEDRGASTKQLTAELERIAATTGARALVFAQERRVLCGVFNDGPTEGTAAALLVALEHFRGAAARALHANIARVDVVLREGAVVTLAPLSAQSRFSLLAITSGRALDVLEIERLIGRIRRLVPPAAEKTALLAAGGGEAS